MAKIRILLADDHPVLRQGMRRLIEHERDMVVVAEADDGAEVPALINLHHPDVLVLDLAMRQVSGVETLRQLRAKQSDCKVLVLTVHEDRAFLREVLEAGALGFMLKRAANTELIEAIRSVARGTAYVDGRITPELVQLVSSAASRSDIDAPELTAREVNTLRYIAEGYSNKEIGAALRISVKTVETYKARAMRKLGLRSRIDIVRLARQRGWPPIS